MKAHRGNTRQFASQNCMPRDAHELNNHLKPTASGQILTPIQDMLITKQIKTIYCTTNSTELNSELVRKFPAFSQRKVYYIVRKSPPPVPVPSQMYSVHTIPAYFLKLSLVLLRMISLLQVFPTNFLHAFLVSPTRTIGITNFIILDPDDT